MEAVLKHMLDMTGQRDHDLVDLSILSAVWEMADAQQARMLQLSTRGEETVVEVRGWVRPHEIKVIHDSDGGKADTESSCFPLRQLPALEQCLLRGAGWEKGRSIDGAYMLWLPIWLEGKANVCLEVTRNKPYSRRIVDLLEGMVGVYRNFQSLLEYSERDSLTSLLNRKTFERHFTHAKQGDALKSANNAHIQMERRHLDQNKLEWLAVVDIDFFKLVNDNFGHLYGDEVLILVANLMKEAFRTNDRIFRFGGEEFVIMIHAADLEDVRMVVERFRLRVQSYQFPQVGQITVSIGYTSFQPMDSPVEVLGHADQALYFAKSNGRNRSCQYEHLVAEGLLQTVQVLPTSPTEYF
ncbi:MAG: GGDEF domain-containing protein [Burkholderiales bacterium]|nr:GGDEF domain-containing protein [Burkholderiales bacterium]